MAKSMKLFQERCSCPEPLKAAPAGSKPSSSAPYASQASPLTRTKSSEITGERTNNSLHTPSLRKKMKWERRKESCGLP